MKAKERATVAELANIFSRLQPSYILRQDIANALHRLQESHVTQVFDLYGHVAPVRGAEILVCRNAEILLDLQRDYPRYLPEHPLWLKWNEVLLEDENSVASMGERTSSAAWSRCGFLNDMCKRAGCPIHC